MPVHRTELSRRGAERSETEEVEDLTDKVKSRGVPPDQASNVHGMRMYWPDAKENSPLAVQRR